MSDLTLHYAVPSRGITVHWMLEELGVPYQRNILSIEKEEHKTPEFLAINPMGRVPALTHGDRVVTETADIIMYLAEAFPESGLDVPPGSPERHSYLRWMFFAPVSAEPTIMWSSLGEITTENDYLPFATPEDVARTLTSALEGREYIVSDHFTAADVMIGATVMWGTRLMPELPSNDVLEAYWTRLEQRPAWQRAFGDDMALMGEATS